MPRTKISKNTKRNRDDIIREERIAKILQDFDFEAQQKLDELENKYQKDVADISHAANRLEDVLVVDENTAPNSSIWTVNATSTNISLKKTQQKDDEGYNTEGSNSGSQNKSTNLISPSPIVKKNKARRSKSATPLLIRSKSTIRSQPMLLTGQKNRLTPLVNSHLSRSKFRTPIKNRIKAASADRVYGDEPISMMRYANIGETVVSLSGSPVIVTNQAIGGKANINIPTKDGILSLRPTETAKFDSQFINRIDNETLGHLRLLQRNLRDFTEMLESKSNPNK